MKKYRCQDTERELKKIWRLANYVANKKDYDAEKSLRDLYYTKLKEYQERRVSLSGNYIFK